MKTRFTTIVGLLILVGSACQQDSFLDGNQEQENDKTAFNHYVPNLNINLETAKYTADLLSHSPVKNVTPIVSQPHDTVMYVVNCENGWMLLSADKRVSPVLASSPIGEFNENSNNPGVVALLNSFGDKLLTMKRQKEKTDVSKLKTNENFMFWSRMTWGAAAKGNKAPLPKLPLTRRSKQDGSEEADTFVCKRLVSNYIFKEEVNHIGHRTETKWGQYYPWNTNLPEVYNGTQFVYPPTGCTAVAMAQLLYFTHFKFNVPSGLNHDVIFSGRIIDGHNYNKNFTPGHYVANSTRWDEMARFWAKPCKQTSYVADLMAELGYYLGMDYTPEKSGAHVSTEVLKRYGIYCDESDYQKNTVIQNIEKGCPVLISAFGDPYKEGILFWNKTHYRSGHTWLIDGIVDRHRVMRSEYQWELVIVEQPSEGSGYHNPYEELDKYEEVLNINAARNMGIREGDRIYNYYNNDVRFLQMNWGWEGYGDDLEFSPDAEIWSIDKHNYQYDKRIFYNVRPLNKN